MNKRELASRTMEVLRSNNIRKPVFIKKHTFHITDDDGNTANFHVKQQDKNVIYTVDDTMNVIDACIAVMVDAIKNGEEISIKGFGTLGLRHRTARRTKEPLSGEWCEIEARYVPKFSFGNDLRMAARLYELSLPEDNQEGEHDQDGEQ